MDRPVVAEKLRRVRLQRNPTAVDVSGRKKQRLLDERETSSAASTLLAQQLRTPAAMIYIQIYFSASICQKKIAATSSLSPRVRVTVRFTSSNPVDGLPIPPVYSVGRARERFLMPAPVLVVHLQPILICRVTAVITATSLWHATFLSIIKSDLIFSQRLALALIQ